jgi:membrane-associated phospholipid phosphatase
MTDPARRLPPPRLIAAVAAVVAILLVTGLGVLLALREAEPGLDTEWMAEIIEHRSPIWELPSRLADFLGGGWFGVILVPVAGAIGFLIAKRAGSALTFVVALGASALLVQALKALFGRVRPDEMLIPLDSASFPSGHVANAATLAVVLGLLLARTWVWVVGVLAVVAMALSRTYLGVHWMSDTIAGGLLGAGVAILVWLAFAPLLRRDAGLAEARAGNGTPPGAAEKEE